MTDNPVWQLRLSPVTTQRQTPAKPPVFTFSKLVRTTCPDKIKWWAQHYPRSGWARRKGQLVQVWGILL